MANQTNQNGPYKLVTVNTAPERAKRLVGKMIIALKDRYDIEHVANCERIEEVKPTVTDLQPDILFCASMWTKAESEEIRDIARTTRPGILTYAVPQGLQTAEGPDAVVAHLVENVPKLLESQAK